MIFKFIVTIFKCLNNMAPQQLTDKLSLICPLNMILDDNTFRPKSAYGRRSFTYLAPRYWNATPRDLRIIPDIALFKKELKFYLFDNTDNFLHRVHPYTTYSISQPGRINQFTNERLIVSSYSNTFWCEYVYFFILLLGSVDRSPYLVFDVSSFFYFGVSHLLILRSCVSFASAPAPRQSFLSPGIRLLGR